MKLDLIVLCHVNIAYFSRALNTYSRISHCALDRRVSVYTQMNRMIVCNSILALLPDSVT